MFEYLDSDLEALIKAKGVVLSPGDIKAYMMMLLKALDSCHKHWVLHRDIKPNNMLISRNGEGGGEGVLSVCVFGGEGGHGVCVCVYVGGWTGGRAGRGERAEPHAIAQDSPSSVMTNSILVCTKRGGCVCRA